MSAVVIAMLGFVIDAAVCGLKGCAERKQTRCMLDMSDLFPFLVYVAWGEKKPFLGQNPAPSRYPSHAEQVHTSVLWTSRLTPFAVTHFPPSFFFLAPFLHCPDLLFLPTPFLHCQSLGNSVAPHLKGADFLDLVEPGRPGRFRKELSLSLFSEFFCFFI